MEPQIAVVIPTKNEEGNILPLFERLKKLKIKMFIIYIDDPSTDGTGKLEESLKKKYPRMVDVVHRDRCLGLGKALLCGYDYALRHTNAKFIAQMDGDGQHDPAYLPAMLEAARKGAGVVLGSRYVESGSVGEWGLWRRLTSWGANILVRRALGGADVRDATTGYRVFRRGVIEKIARSKPRSSGYVFQIEALAIAARYKTRIAEVPIEFKPRTSGSSKLRFRDKKEFFVFALRNMF